MLEGQNITFLWTYTLGITKVLALFANVTGGTSSSIAVSAGGDTGALPEFQKRFTAEISDTEAKITMLAVQMSDDKNKFKLHIAINNSASLVDYVELIVQCK